MNKLLSRNSKKSASKKTNLKPLTFKQLVIVLVVATIGLFGLSGYYWYKNVLVNPDRILSDMLDKSLQTTSVQRSVEQENQQGSLDQSMLISFSPNLIAQSKTTLKEATLLGDTTIVTETIGAQDAGYVRYNSIDIKNSQSSPNFEKVLGVWGKQENNAQSGQSISLLEDAMFSVVPFGNLDKDQRHEVKSVVDELNLYEYTKSETKYIDGRPHMVYTISLNPKSMVGVLSKLTELSGNGGSDQLNPALYEGVQDVNIELQVDILSRHVSKVEFLESGRKESYSSYNLKRKITVPKDTISVGELQGRVQNLEQQQ